MSSAPPGRYAAVNRLAMYYEVHGAPGERPPIVLLHGGLLTIDLTFGPILQALAERQQVVAVELQGHGHTADIDREFSLGNLAGDVVALLRQLGIGTADFFGFSLGGMVALEVAIGDPDLVNRLVLASVPFRPDGYHEDVRPPGRPGSKRMPTEEDFQVMEDAYARVAPDPGHFSECAAKASAAVESFEGWSPDVLRGIGAPTLILVGDTDFVLLEHAVEMFELIPGAQLAMLPGTTHMQVMRDADRLLSLIGPFLEG
ncbi:MAG TPA: alpha/beta hydrolase [Actinomycetota bacterium]|nr:alpha/beta hydrolase [Actinomycetota bacterium]